MQRAQLRRGQREGGRIYAPADRHLEQRRSFPWNRYRNNRDLGCRSRSHDLPPGREDAGCFLGNLSRSSSGTDTIL